MTPTLGRVNRYDRSSLLLGTMAFIGPLALYISTMRPDIDFWDTGEMQTVPWILGIAHPTGFPAFVLGGFAFAHLVPIGTVAWRFTLFSATAMAITAWTLFAAAREIRLSSITALIGAWIFASTQLAWTRGTRTEVHALAICWTSAALWIGLRYLRTRNPWLLPVGALCLSLSLGTHPIAIFFVPLMFIWMLLGWTRPKSGAFVLPLVLAMLAGPLLYLYMPLRSAQVTRAAIDPTLSLGIAPGRPYWDYGHTATFSGFLQELSGSAFTVGGGFGGILSPAVYAKLPTVFFTDLATALGGHGVLPVLIIGAYILARRIGFRAAGSLLICGFLAVPFAASYTSESDVPRYFLAAYWLAALLFVLSIETIVFAVFRSIELHLPRRNTIPHFVRCVASMLVLVPIIWANLVTDWPQMQAQHSDDAARAFIDRVIAETPANAIIVSFWTYATPLAYAAYVERSLHNRIVETAWPAEDAPYFHTWLQQRPIVVVTVDGSLPPNVTGAKALDSAYPQLMLVTQAR